MPRVVTALLLVAMLFAFVTIASATTGLGSGAPSAVAALFDGFSQDAYACLGGCKGKP